ncbi:MAG: hypothetical protein EA420_01820 [Candidatus Competibacteraceae bacterium]|nr:MAG: hypothetical protein EA420_01820 [Candidatus Competibacteraceae bacterium]
MTPSYQTFLNLAEADSAVITRLEGEPVRWYVMLRNATHQRVAGATDRDGWMLLWSDRDAAMDWLREQRPDLVAAQARDAD